MDHFGYWSIVPPLVAIVAAIWTRKVYLSLGSGIVVGALIFAGGNPLLVPQVFIGWMLGEITDPFNSGIIVFTLFLGGLVALMQKAGGMRGFAEWATHRADTPRKGQFSGWFLGTFIVFIDDYFDTITVGTVMRPVTDRLKISREKLAYIVDTTAAPVAIIAPISTWVGFIVAQIRPMEDLFAYTSYELFLRSIPFNFYAFAAILWALVIVVTGVEYGPMRQAERRARQTGQLLRPGARPMQSAELDQLGAETTARPRVTNLVLPIAVLVFSTVFFLWYTGYRFLLDDGLVAPSALDAIRNADASLSLVLASFIVLLYVGVTFLMQRAITMDDYFSSLEVGFRSMLPALMVLVLAWTIGRAAQTLGLGETMAELAAGTVPPAVFPALAFILACLIAFSTGTSFGTFAIMLPITIPIAAAFSPEMIPIAIGATVGGAVFGDHASPISDTTVISSLASGCDHVDHVRTQIPYAMTAAGVALVAYLIAGTMVSGGSGLLATGSVSGTAALLLLGVTAAAAWFFARDDPYVGPLSDAERSPAELEDDRP